MEYDYFIMITDDKYVIDIFNVISIYFKNKPKYKCLYFNNKIKTNYAAGNILLLWYYKYYKNSKMTNTEIINFIERFINNKYLTILYFIHRIGYELFIRSNNEDKTNLVIRLNK